MLRDSEQWAVIKYCVAKGYSQTQTFKEIQGVYQDNAMGRTQVRHWWLKFSEGDGLTPVADDPHIGRPKDPGHLQLVTRVKEMIMDDTCLTIRQIARRTRTSYGTIHHILKEELKVRKLAAKFIPIPLMPKCRPDLTFPGRTWLFWTGTDSS